jgi:4-amino-4-deoxy-L-arabinose transferase-like glycosyltransferase
LRQKTRSLWSLVGLVSIWLAIAGQRRIALRDYVLDGVLLLAVSVVLFLAASWRRGAGQELAVWPQNVHAPLDGREVALVGGRLQQLLIAIVVLLSAVAFLSLGGNQFTVRGVVCWAGAVLAWLLANVHVRPDVLRVPRGDALRQAVLRGSAKIRVSWTALALLAILLVSLFFHVYRIDAIPAEAQSDHVEASEDVRSILNGDHMIFFPRNTGREATQFYLTAALSRVFGYSFFTLKLTMALVGALNVIPMYFLGRELVDKRFGLLAAFFMAISYWHVIVSRIGWRIALAPFWTTVTLYFLLRAFRTGRRNDYLLGGLSLGAGLYGYMSFRIAPALIVLLFVLKAALDCGPAFEWKAYLLNGFLLVVTSMLVYLPMFRYMYDEPRMLWYRVLTRTTDLERAIELSPAAVFVNNVKRALQMFNWTGDGAWTTSVPGRPALDVVSGGLVVLGAAYLLYLLLVKRRPMALYLLVAIPVLLLPSTMAIAFPIENPSNIRASGVIPVIIVLVALPLYVVARQLLYALRGGTGLLLVVVAGAVLMWQAARLNYELYFVDYDQQYRRAAWNASDIARVMQGFADSLGSIYDAHYIGTAHWVDHRAIALTLRNMEWNNLIMNMREAEPHLAEPRNRLYILHPGNAEAERWLREHYPNGRLMRFQAFVPDKDFLIYLALAQS